MDDLNLLYCESCTHLFNINLMISKHNRLLFTTRKNQQMFCLRKIKPVSCIVTLLSSKTLMSSICIIFKSIYIHYYDNIYFILLTADLNESKIHICHESNVTMQEEIFMP